MKDLQLKVQWLADPSEISAKTLVGNVGNVFVELDTLYSAPLPPTDTRRPLRRHDHFVSFVARSKCLLQ